ncbi:hypothetical protein [Fischerella sp. FACHB-380]|nr:hypothetical protein [Fischerella sp. FACHB-380]
MKRLYITPHLPTSPLPLIPTPPREWGPRVPHLPTSPSPHTPHTPGGMK